MNCARPDLWEAWAGNGPGPPDPYKYAGVERQRSDFGYEQEQNKRVVMISINKLLAPKRPEPSYPKLPAIDADGQTTVPGLFAVGEIAGTSLVKFGLNAGHDLAHHFARELKSENAPDSLPEGSLDLIIIGAGAAGLGWAELLRHRNSACPLWFSKPITWPRRSTR
ncbi:MAG: hypothetical protein ACI8TQ_001011 [Planctomycetota bacterium]